MATTRIINQTPEQPKEIDWSKKQFLKHVNTGAIVYSTGDHFYQCFEGWAYTGGFAMTFSKGWLKECFQPLQGKVTLEISND